MRALRCFVSRAALLLAAAALARPASARAQARPAPPVAPVGVVIAAGDSACPETIERLLAVSEAERSYQRALEMTISAQTRGNPALASSAGVLRAFMARYASYAAVKGDMARVYRETFTEAEVRELIQFYRSDFGRRFMGKLPLVTARSNELMAQRLQAHLPELMTMLQEAARAGGRP